MNAERGTRNAEAPAYLNARQVAVMCSSGEKPVGTDRVREWTRLGVKVRGVAERIKLKCVRMPRGMAWRVEDVQAFLDAIVEAWSGGHGQAGEPGRAPALRLAGTARKFERCAVNEIGTFPGTRRGTAGPPKTDHVGRGMDAHVARASAARA